MSTERLESFLDGNGIQPEDNCDNPTFAAMTSGARIAYYLKNWMIFGSNGRYDDYTPRQLNDQMREIFGDEIIQELQDFNEQF